MLFEIAIVLIVAKLFSLLFEKIKQPGVLGEIIAGIILGPCLFGALTGVSVELFGTKIYTFGLQITSPEFKELAFIGIIFLLFIVGLQTDTRELKKNGKAGIYIAIFSLLISFIFGYIVGMTFTQNLLQSIAIAVIFIATSITLTIRLFSELQLLSSRVGFAVHTADILNDIIVIFFLSLLMGEGNSVVFLLKITIFFVITLCAGFLIIHFAAKRNTSRRSPILILTVSLIVCFLFAAFAENMGIAGIIGAFFAGLILRRTPQVRMIIDQIEMIGHTFFTPLYFVWVGASFNLIYFFYYFEKDWMVWLFIGSIVFFGLISKFIGSYIGARFAGFNKTDSKLVGIGMMPRLGIVLILVTTEVDRGFFGSPSGPLAQQILLATLLLIIVSTFLTPVILKRNLIPHYIRHMKKNIQKKKTVARPCCFSLRIRNMKRIPFSKQNL
ncbi:MAG: cation:proton antiporter [Candidatus Thermoplasmatota archaeon]